MPRNTAAPPLHQDVIAWRAINRALDRLQPWLADIWHEGDGRGGALFAAIRERVEAEGLEFPDRPNPGPRS